MLKTIALGLAVLSSPALSQVAKTTDQDIVVTGRTNDGYRAVDTDALGIDLTTKELPATVNVITSQFLIDSGARKLADVIAYTPGVVNNETAGTVADFFVVRGFSTTFTYLNGVRQGFYDQRRGLATIDRVEILKGPAGSEAGVADPGGTVNILTKKPLATFAASMSAALGDYHFRNVTGDVTGPVALDGKLQARLVGGYQQDESWRPGQRDRKPFVTIAPSLKLDYLPGGSLTVEYEHDYSKSYYDRGVIYLRGFYPGGFGPRSSSAVNSELNFSRTKNDRVDVGLEQKLGRVFTATLRFQDATARNRGRSLDAEPRQGDIYADDGITWNGTGTTIPFFYSEGPNPSHFRTYTGSLKAEFGVAGIRNTVVAGYDHLRNVTGNRYSNYAVTNVLDIRNPDNDQQPDIIPGTRDDIFFRGVEVIDSYYAKWVARLGDRLRLLGSVRRDDYDQSSIFTVTGANPFDTGLATLSDRLTSYRVAASYDVTGTITGFVGYANGFTPQGGRSRNGPVPALRARSLEAGVKVSLADGRALWTNTLYSIRQDNLTIDDPTNLPGQDSFVVLFGAVRARGFESELTGRVLPGLDLSAGFSYLKSRVVENADGLKGNRFLNVPEVQASAFASYNLAALGVAPLTARVGVNAIGNREGNVENTFRLPGYVRVDAGVGYAINEHLTADLRVENLLDKTYYLAADQGGNGGGTVSVGNRRLVQASLGYRF